MKLGIPGQVAEVGWPGHRKPASLGQSGVSAAKGRDRPDEDGCRAPEGPENTRFRDGRDDRAAPKAAPFALRAGSPNTEAVAALRDKLAEIRLILQEARPRRMIEAVQGEASQLAERVDNCRDGIDAASVAAIKRQLAEIRDALTGLKPAESLASMACVAKQLSDKIDIFAGSWDAAVVRQLGGAVAAMRSVVSHVASPEAMAQLSERVRTLGAKLDDARSRADSRILSALEARIAMLSGQLQTRDRSGPNGSDKLKLLIERLVDRIERMELLSESAAVPARLENLIAKLLEKLDVCDTRLDQLATIESTLVEQLIHIERRQASTLGRDAALPPAVEALSRDVADLRQTEKQTQDSLEVAYGTLTHLVERLAMIETDIRRNPPHAPDAPPAASAGVPILAPPPKPPKASVPLEGPVTTPAQSAKSRHSTDNHVLLDRPPELGSGPPCNSNPDSSLDRGISPETAFRRANPPTAEDSGGTSNFIAAARRAARGAGRGVLTENEPLPVDVASDEPSARSLGKLGVLISGTIVIMVIGVLQVMGFLLQASDEPEVSAPLRTAATSTDAIMPSLMLGQAAVPALADADRRGFPVVSPARRQLDLFRYVDGTVITTPGPGSVVPGWTLEQLLEAQMSPERWNDATSGVSAPARRKLPVIGPVPDLGPLRRAQ